METKKEYLRRILNIKNDDIRYAEMDTPMKEYNTFMKTLNLSSQRGGAEEKLFIEFCVEKKTTISNYVKKNQGKEELLDKVRESVRRSFEYYETSLAPQIFQEIEKAAPKNQIIISHDQARNNSITIFSLENVEKYLNHLDEGWNNFNASIQQILNLEFSGNYDDDRMRITHSISFDLAVRKEISYMEKQIYNYEEGEKDEYCYIGRNDNPYKNLAIYCLMAFIKNFYIAKIPEVERNAFFELKYFETSILDKTYYTLEDIAELYASMTGDCLNKVYGRFKQQFRKLNCVKKYKKGKKYEFPDAAQPLAIYVYYRKKNHKEEYSEKSTNNVLEVYTLLLKGFMCHKKESINAFVDYCDFIKKTFNRAMSVVNDAYMKMILDLIFGSAERLYYRCMGIDVDKVIG